MTAIPGIRVQMNAPAALLNPRPRGVDSIPDTELLRRAMETACSRKHNKGVKHPLWVAVMDWFMLGSTYARELCLRFNIDPDKEVSR